MNMLVRYLTYRRLNSLKLSIMPIQKSIKKIIYGGDFLAEKDPSSDKTSLLLTRVCKLLTISH